MSRCGSPSCTLLAAHRRSAAQLARNLRRESHLQSLSLQHSSLTQVLSQRPDVYTKPSTQIRMHVFPSCDREDEHKLGALDLGEFHVGEPLIWWIICSH